MATNYTIVTAVSMVNLKVASDAFLIANPGWAPTGEPFWDAALNYSQAMYLVPTGPPPPPGDKNFVWTQAIAASVWNVPHNLGKFCAVQITNPAQIEIEGKIEWIDINNVQITFNKPKTGFVYCN
jgi:hypothetical protein